MGRIEEKFAKLKQENRKALITFITAGDPDLDTTRRLVLEMEKKGADLIELGIPYSDPVAEGPVIQRANERALKNKVKIKNIMELVQSIRRDSQIPILYLLYFNSILRYNPENFFRDCLESGIDGLIIPDLPYEERGEIEEYSVKYGIPIITLVSPTSRERIARIAKDAKGFLYLVSSLGVTGSREKFSTDFNRLTALVREHTSIPIAIGFGISNREHVSYLKNYADGLIIGSAIVKLIEESQSPDDAVGKVGDFVSEMRKELDK